MRKATTMTTERASLCALGEYLRRRCFFAPLMEQVKIAQKVVKYCPMEKLLDGLLGMMCGAKTIAQSNVTIKVEPAVQRAFERKGCAEQSTIARTLHTCTAENVAQPERVSWCCLKRYRLTPRRPLHEERLWVDANVTPMPIGAKAEGSERAWMGRCRSKTGRKTLRLMVLLLARLAHHQLLWNKRWLSRVPATRWRLRGYRVVRLLQEVWTVPGMIR
jgi:hypothetical protein